MTTANDPAEPAGQLTDLDRWKYEQLKETRLHHDQLVWQVPALSLTAQAFLFTISLAPDTSRLARILAATLSVVAAVLSIQLMARHRLSELTMARRLEDFERANGLVPANFAGTLTLDRGPRFARPLASLRSFDVWVWGLALFGATGALSVGVAIFAPSWLA